jgi:putative nucleotidyltransferase with HDIG domain
MSSSWSIRGFRRACSTSDDSSAGNKLTAEPVARLRPIDVYEVPTLPTIVMQALKVMQDPNSDARAVERVIIHDPAISAKILRVANSAFFGFSRRVGTIAEAVRVLGFTNVQGMLISVGAFDAFRTKRLSLVEFWQHSIAVATAARFLSTRVNCSADEAFMAGLLHDIGKLILAVQAEASYQQVLELKRGSAMTSLEAEHTLFEFTHPEVGQMVAERWDLPARHVAAIAHHHNPADAGDERLFCTLIGLADQAAYTALSPYTPVEHDAERIALLDRPRPGSRALGRLPVSSAGGPDHHRRLRGRHPVTIHAGHVAGCQVRVRAPRPAHRLNKRLARPPLARRYHAVFW